mmetsp:Transcript_33767/g.62140  ORF Transcript_33767/g.62140 Transcript_33767/m.62140 type:complete len:207 (+) Transcript_33767:3594-4214(+)
MDFSFLQTAQSRGILKNGSFGIGSFFFQPTSLVFFLVLCSDHSITFDALPLQPLHLDLFRRLMLACPRDWSLARWLACPRDFSFLSLRLGLFRCFRCQSFHSRSFGLRSFFFQQMSLFFFLALCSDHLITLDTLPLQPLNLSFSGQPFNFRSFPFGKLIGMPLIQFRRLDNTSSSRRRRRVTRLGVILTKRSIQQLFPLVRAIVPC